MPQISSFYGIVITMYFSEHGAPHFHARRGEFSAKVEIATGEVMVGRLVRRDARLVRRWARIHGQELEDNWMRAEAHLPLANIAPLT
ncbi:MAG TPA: DUF4160 domain-containing protein [Solirubrobacterales bacterium]